MVILAISITINIILFVLALVLFYARCKNCSKDKEIRQAFSKFCKSCEKNNKETNKNNLKKVSEEL